jgi:hypothetical protein
MEDKYYIQINHENVLGDLFPQVYTAYSYTITGVTGTCYCIELISSSTEFVTGTTIVMSSMTDVLSGGTSGSSLLNITIPILFREDTTDIGYYSVFDGAILQANVVTNFIFSASPRNPNRYYFYNTSEKELKNFLQLSNYVVDWGDNTRPEIITTTSPNYIYHNYFVSGTYTITLTQTTPWGINEVKKTVVVPFTGTTIDNPKGTAYFTSNVGAWSATPVSYDYIFTGDSVNMITAQTSNNYVSVPFFISGFTSSRLTELKQYGANPYPLFTPIIQNNQIYGVINTKSPTYTGYTIQGVQYLDFPDGTTSYIFESVGLRPDWMVQSALTKNEALMNIVMDPEVQSDVFIERGKNSALERVQRLGEVDNIGDLEQYGYGFFNFVDFNNIKKPI